MKIPGNDNCHLTYCLNVHPARTRAEMHDAVFRSAVSVIDFFQNQAELSGPFGLGLWLNDTVAREMDSPDACRQLADELAEHNLYVPTFNGFPFGVFHGTRVKEDVYRPDWSDPRRAEYTLRLARIMSRLLPDSDRVSDESNASDISSGSCASSDANSPLEGSISSVPVTYRAWADPNRVEQAISQILTTVRELHDLYKTSGRVIRLALEPEPDCLLDDCQSVLDFWELLRRQASPGDDELLDRYLGVCLDTAHTATLFEDTIETLDQLNSAGIRVVKLQISAVPEVPADADTRPDELLAPFRDAIYLHQTCIRTKDGHQLRYPDLPNAIDDYATRLAANASPDPLPDECWRTHFHVPLSWQPEGELQTTTRLVNPDLIRAARRHGVEHFELEVYSLGLILDIPEQMHKILADDLCRLWSMF